MKTVLRILSLAIALTSVGAFADSLRSDRHFVKIDAKANLYNVQIFDAESRQQVAQLKVTASDDAAEAQTTAGDTRYRVVIYPHGTSYLVAFTADDGQGGIDSMRGGFSQRPRSEATPARPAQAGRDVKQPKVTRRIEPAYTDDARAAGAAGTVVMEALIDKSGFVREARVVKSMGYGLDEAAADAVKQWQFEASMKERVPVEVLAEVTIEFKP